MKTKLLKSIFLALLLSASALTATAYDFMVDGLCYNKNSDGTSVTVTYQNTSSPWYSNLSGNLVIPETVTYSDISYSVTSIDYSAFRGCSGLTSVTIPNSVTTIGAFAFDVCSSLTSVTIPNSVTYIGERAFFGTPWFNNQPDGLVYAGLVAYTYKGTMPSGTSIVLKDDTKGIATWAFYGCGGLTSITIPNSVTTIGNEAFEFCGGLTNVHITDLAAWCNIAFGGWYANPLYYAHHLFLDGTEVKDLVIPNSVTSIGAYAFYSCSGLTSVTIPNSVTSIDNYAFYECSGLTSVTIGNSVTSIGNEAFRVCSSLTSITIPNSVTSIGDKAFSGCTGLTSVTIPNSVTSIGAFAFWGCSGLTSITIPNSVTSIDAAFSGCTGLTSVTIPNSVTTIGSEAFYYCSGLTSITIPNSVTSIDNQAFYACSRLRNVTIGNSVISIGEKAFYIDGYPNGKTLTLCGGVEYIGNDAFKSSRSGTNIATLILKDSVVSIKNLGADPNQIYCYATTPPECDGNSFTKYTGTLHVPENSIVAYATADYWSNFANLVNDAVEPQSVSLSQSEAEIEPGNTLTLTATVTPSNATPNTVRWTTSNSEVATVATNGQVTAVGFGECNITATVADKTAVCHVTVREQQVVISLDNHELYVGVNKIAWLTPSMSPVSTDLAVESSNTGVAIAQMNNGRVRVIGVSPGVATVTVSSVDGTAQPDSCVVTVEPDFYYLTITSGGHASVRQKVAPRGTYTYTLTPNGSEGRVKMVKFNGEDVTSQVSNGIYTTPAITENSTLEVTFE